MRETVFFVFIVFPDLLSAIFCLSQVLLFPYTVTLARRFRAVYTSVGVYISPRASIHRHLPQLPGECGGTGACARDLPWWDGWFNPQALRNKVAQIWRTTLSVVVESSRSGEEEVPALQPLEIAAAQNQLIGLIGNYSELSLTENEGQVRFHPFPSSVFPGTASFICTQVQSHFSQAGFGWGAIFFPFVDFQTADVREEVPILPRGELDGYACRRVGVADHMCVGLLAATRADAPPAADSSASAGERSSSDSVLRNWRDRPHERVSFATRLSFDTSHGPRSRLSSPLSFFFFRFNNLPRAPRTIRRTRYVTSASEKLPAGGKLLRDATYLLEVVQ